MRSRLMASQSVDGIKFILVFLLSFHLFLKYFFGVPHLATFIFMYVVCNSQHCLHPSSIRCQGSNPQPLDCEPSALTTRPWLSPLISPVLVFLQEEFSKELALVFLQSFYVFGFSFSLAFLHVFGFGFSLEFQRLFNMFLGLVFLQSGTQ